MLNANINKVEKVEGSNIFIFQYVDSEGNATEERKSLEEFLKPFVKSYLEQIALLKDQLLVQKELIKEKEENKIYLNKEVLSLSQKIQELEDGKQQRISQIEHLLQEVSGKDLSDETSLYKEAFNLFVEEKIEDALLVLSEVKLQEAEQKIKDKNKKRSEAIDNDNRKLAQNRILKAQLLRIKHKYKEAGENYEKAIILHESWDTYYEAANYFWFVNEMGKSESHFYKALNRITSDEQKSATLHNLGHLQQKKNELYLSEKSYTEALTIRRKLASQNPKKYLRHVASTLDNLAVLQQINNEYDKSEKSFKKALEIKRKLNENQEFRLSNISITLNNLGYLQQKVNKPREAEESYINALSIRRNLANQNPELYLSDLATTLNNLAFLKRNENNFDEAEKYYIESLSIRRSLVSKNPSRYLPYLASSLDGIGHLYYLKKDKFHKSEEFLLEALSIRKKLSNCNREVYLLDLANTLNNLAVLRRIQNRIKIALELLVDVLQIDRELASQNPQAYLPNVATTLNNIGNLYFDNKEFDESFKALREALEIRRNLSKRNPKVYLPKLANSLNSLASLQITQKLFLDSRKNHDEALFIYKKLAKENPRTFLPDVARTLINLSVFYQECKIDKEQSLEYLEEAISILLPFKEIGYIQNYLQRGFQVLKDWDIDVETYLQEKFPNNEEE